MRDYTFSLMIKTGWDYLMTKLFYPNARLIRRPVYMRGKKGLKFDKGFTTGVGCRIDASNEKIALIIGKDARIGDYVHINAMHGVIIGDNVLVASKVFITDTSHGAYSGENQSKPDINPSLRELYFKSVKIGNNVWIGENVVILPGTKIGDGCIVGANSVLAGKEYPDNSIIVGVPGRIIKKYDDSTKHWESV